MSDDKKYWYITEDTDVTQTLVGKGIFHIWGGITGTTSVTNPQSAKYLVCVNWSGRDLQQRRDFEAQPHVTPLPHKNSRVAVDTQVLAMLGETTKNSGKHAIQLTDHTFDIVEKLSGHTGWDGWWHHL